MGPVKQLQTLIDHLDTVEFRVCPHGVGLKTAIRARELGLVEFKGEERGRWTYRLTPRGWDYKASLMREVVGRRVLSPPKIQWNSN
jgi:DNA-binding PadR family transcriptional regulator